MTPDFEKSAILLIGGIALVLYLNEVLLRHRATPRVFVVLLVISTTIPLVFTLSTPKTSDVFGTATASVHTVLPVLFVSFLLTSFGSFSLNLSGATGFVIRVLPLLVAIGAVVGIPQNGLTTRSIVDGAFFTLPFFSFLSGTRIPVSGRAARGVLSCAVYVSLPVAFAQIITGNGIEPISTLTAGAFTGLTLMGIFRRAPLLVLFGVLLLGVAYLRNPYASQSLLLQSGIGFFVVVAAGLRRLDPRLRPALVLPAVAVAAAIGPAVTQYVRLLNGTYAGYDASLAARAFEASLVNAKVAHFSVASIYGSGLGSTVNLSNSPDTATLTNSGRDVFHVPTIHLLPTYLELKFGLLGIVWLVLLVVAIARMFTSALRTQNTEALGLIAFMLVALLDAMTAGNHLFQNPIPWFLLGVAERLIAAEPLNLTTPPPRATATSTHQAAVRLALREPAREQEPGAH